MGDWFGKLKCLEQAIKMYVLGRRIQETTQMQTECAQSNEPDGLPCSRQPVRLRF